MERISFSGSQANSVNADAPALMGSRLPPLVAQTDQLLGSLTPLEAHGRVVDEPGEQHGFPHLVGQFTHHRLGDGGQSVTAPGQSSKFEYCDTQPKAAVGSFLEKRCADQRLQISVRRGAGTAEGLGDVVRTDLQAILGEHSQDYQRTVGRAVAFSVSTRLLCHAAIIVLIVRTAVSSSGHRPLTAVIQAMNTVLY